MNAIVSIIILNWNGGRDTVECLGSLEKIDYRPATVIVIDNGSIDGSAERIEREFPYVRMIRNHENVGFAEGNNIGIKYALDHGAEFVLLLNNDTVVDKGFLSELMSVARREPAAGILGPKILLYADPTRIWFAGPKRNWVFGRRLELGHRGYGEKDSGKYDQVEEVGFMTGCALVLRREAIETIGLLDADFFAYFEDADYCVRAKKAGYKLMYVPQAKVWHKAASSAADGRSYSAVTLYLSIRNRLLFMKKHGSKQWWLIFIACFCVVLVRLWVDFVLRRKPRAWNAILTGVRDFLMGRFGRGSVNTFSRN